VRRRMCSIGCRPPAAYRVDPQSSAHGRRMQHEHDRRNRPSTAAAPRDPKSRASCVGAALGNPGRTCGREPSRCRRWSLHRVPTQARRGSGPGNVVRRFAARGRPLSRSRQMPGYGAKVAHGTTRAPRPAAGATAPRVVARGWWAWVALCATYAPHPAESQGEFILRRRLSSSIVQPARAVGR
jgi:hypothetical protein